MTATDFDQVNIHKSHHQILPPFSKATPRPRHYLFPMRMHIIIELVTIGYKMQRPLPAHPFPRQPLASDFICEHSPNTLPFFYWGYFQGISADYQS